VALRQAFAALVRGSDTHGKGAAPVGPLDSVLFRQDYTLCT